MEKQWTALAQALLLITALLAGLGCDSQDDEALPEGVVRWDSNGHLYHAVLVPEGVSWTEAHTVADAMGDGWHLATITSAEENAFVYGLVSGDSAFWNCCLSNNSAGPWIGGLKMGDGSYGWVTGEPFSYTNWGPREPFGNGDRIGLFGYQTFMGPHWNDVPADRPEYGYILEKAPP